MNAPQVEIDQNDLMALHNALARKIGELEVQTTVTALKLQRTLAELAVARKQVEQYEAERALAGIGVTPAAAPNGRGKRGGTEAAGARA